MTDKLLLPCQFFSTSLLVRQARNNVSPWQTRSYCKNCYFLVFYFFGFKRFPCSSTSFCLSYLDCYQYLCMLKFAFWSHFATSFIISCVVYRALVCNCVITHLPMYHFVLYFLFRSQTHSFFFFEMKRRVALIRSH